MSDIFSWYARTINRPLLGLQTAQHAGSCQCKEAPRTIKGARNSKQRHTYSKELLITDSNRLRNLKDHRTRKKKMASGYRSSIQLFTKDESVKSDKYYSLRHGNPGSSGIRLREAASGQGERDGGRVAGL